jgi:outer membrane receptor protein involved in Fe transport
VADAKFFFAALNFYCASASPVNNPATQIMCFTKMIKCFNYLIILNLFSLFSNEIFAHEAEVVEKIQVLGNYANGLSTSDAASQGSVNAKLIETRPLQRPGEVLEFVPGVIITQHSGEGKANQYFLRGFNLDHGTDFATSVAGMPVNMPTHAHGQGYSDLNFLIPELVSRVDYKKGPYYADTGDFASAGAANILYAYSLKRGVAELTLGQNNYQRGLLAASPDLFGGHLLYGLEVAHNDGPWQNPSKLKKFNGVLRYNQGTLDNGYAFTGMAYNSNWNSTDQIPLRAVQDGPLNRFGTIDPTDGGKTSRYSFSFEQKSQRENGVFAFNTYAIKYQLNLFSNFTYFLDDPINGDQFEQADSRVIYGLNTSRSWFGKIGAMESINKIGVQLRHDQIDNVALYNTAARQRSSVTRADAVKQTSLGVYAENSLQWKDKLRSILGLRADKYRFNVQSNLGQNSGKTDASLLSPKLSLIAGPWAKTEIFGNIGNGFHSNDARGATITLDPKTLQAVDKVNPLVKSRGAEIGLRTEIIPNLQTSLALWQLKLDSELLFVGDAGTTEASRPSKRHGVEWSAHYTPYKWLLFDLHLAGSKARFSDNDPSGNRIPGAIDKVASAGITIDKLNNFFGSLQLRYFGPRPLTEDGSKNSRATTMVNLRGGYQFTPKWKASLDVFNLLNREASDIDYFYSSQLKTETAPVDDIHFHPVEPRNIRFSLIRNF